MAMNHNSGRTEKLKSRGPSAATMAGGWRTTACKEGGASRRRAISDSGGSGGGGTNSLHEHDCAAWLNFQIDPMRLNGVPGYEAQALGLETSKLAIHKRIAFELLHISLD